MKKNKKLLIPIILICGLSIFIGTQIINNKEVEELPSNGNGVEDIDDTNDTNDTGEELMIEEYFSIKPNTLAVYTSNVGEEYDYSIFNLYANDNTVQRVIYPKFSVTAVEEVLQFVDGDLKYINGTQQGTFYKNLLDDEPIYDITVMKGPLEVGIVWQMSYDSTSTISDTLVIVDTEVGSFTCIEITTNYTDGVFEKSYYAKDIGLVKTISTSSDGKEVIHTLSSYTENIVYEQDFIAYYYVAEEDALRYVPVTMPISSDMSLEENIEVALTEKVDDELYSVLNGATINFINEYRSEGYVHIDLDNYNLNNAGSTGEMIMISGLVNSICQMGNVGKVKLTVNGNYYNSSHLGLLEDFLEPTF